MEKRQLHKCIAQLRTDGTGICRNSFKNWMSTSLSTTYGENMIIEEVRNVDIQDNNTTAKFKAWTKHCCIYYDALLDLLIDRKYILAKDIVTANALVTDIQMITTKVPFEGNLVDMTNDLFHWISMSIKGRELKDLFEPIE